MAPRTRFVSGILIAAIGAALVFSPAVVGEALHRPAATQPEMINLRATWGGSLLGIGAFVAWLPAAKPWPRFVLGLLMWAMAGIGVARAIGFVLDGGPDTLQWVWLIAEIAIAAGCAVALRIRRYG
ncbi:MAG: DUF4345 family protein [Polyangiaceae bacterium]|nr:DUF4345 family protein [Polyangiaceae bacterium]